MSTTTTTFSQASSTTASLNSILAATCPKCGADVSHIQNRVANEAQRRIEELEQQVRILTDKATAAVDKLADYEDQLHQLKSQSQPPPHTIPTNPAPIEAPPPPSPRTHAHDPPPRPSSTVSRLSALLPSTRRSASTPPAASMPNTPFNHIPSPFSPNPSLLPQPPLSAASQPDLLSALSHETSLRLAAENRLSETSAEVEELTSSLFSEANEMVAKERKAVKRLKDELEERRGVQDGLEKKIREKEERLGVLERRAREKDERLERLEQRVGRGERVRGLLRDSMATQTQGQTQAAGGSAV